MFHPAWRKSRVRGSPWRVVGNPSGHFRNVTAPKWVVAGQLIETAIDANILNRHQAIGATNTVIITLRLLEDWAVVKISSSVGASVDRLLENRVRGVIPTVLEVSVVGVSYVVASGQDEGTVVVLELAGVSDLLEEDGHEPERMGRRAGASFMGADRVRDVVLEVGARNVLAVPAGLEQDLQADPVGTGALGEFVRLWNGRLVVAEAMVVERLVRGIRGHRAPGS